MSYLISIEKNLEEKDMTEVFSYTKNGLPIYSYDFRGLGWDDVQFYSLNEYTEEYFQSLIKSYYEYKNSFFNKSNYEGRLTPKKEYFDNCKTFYEYIKEFIVTYKMGPTIYIDSKISRPDYYFSK